ncbi:MAG: aldo/keto reductase [Planctomycetes bacterium]|nr:aldo/keto reductase [Planctomycetota bacterium]
MRTRLFPALSREVSEVGLGCWQLGAEWGDVSDAQAATVLQTAHEHGITFFDTADVYGRGRSERRLQAFLAAGHRPVVATKVGRFPDPGLPQNVAFEVMRRHVQASRERLGVPILDLVQLHCLPRDLLFAGAAFAHLRRLREDGLLRAWGASVESVAEAERCLQEPDCASLQIIFSVLRQTPAVSGLLDRAAARGVAVIVRLPLASGLLAGNWRPDTKFAADDHRTFNRDGAAFHVGETFAGLPWERALAVVEGVRPLLPVGVPMAVAAMRWVLDHPAVTTVIPGATKPTQVVANASASTVAPFGAERHQRLREYWRTEVQPFVRGND